MKFNISEEKQFPSIKIHENFISVVDNCGGVGVGDGGGVGEDNCGGVGVGDGGAGDRSVGR